MSCNAEQESKTAVLDANLNILPDGDRQHTNQTAAVAAGSPLSPLKIPLFRGASTKCADADCPLIPASDMLLEMHFLKKN